MLARGAKKLTLIYLANDVLQNSKKKGPEFNRDFRPVLPEAFKDSFKESDDKMKGSLDRLLGIWVERGVYEIEFLDSVRKAMCKKGKTVEPRESQNHKQNSESEKKPSEKKNSDVPPKKKKKVELSLREEIELEMQDGPGEPPTAEELIKALGDLENSASSDAAVRERIAALPPEVSDATLLEKLTDTAEADVLAQAVDEACVLLANYNSRLSDELTERKRVAKMLRNYIIAQKNTLVESESKLQEYRTRLDKVDSVHRELKSHVQSLPDLTLLPDVTGGLKPLPSAGDLFSTGDKD